MTKSAVVRDLVYCQVSFFALLIIQLILSPEGLINNGGVSYYSVQHNTEVLYVLGFLVSAFFMWRGASRLPKNDTFKINHPTENRQGMKKGMVVLGFHPRSKLTRYSHTKIIRYLLQLCAILLVLITFAPDINGTIIDKFHMFSTRALFVTEMLLAFWIAFWARPNALNISLTLIQLASGLVCLLAITNIFPWLTEAEIAFQLAFGLLIVFSVKDLEGNIAST